MPTPETHVTTFDGLRLYVRRCGHGPIPVIVPNAAHMGKFEQLAGDQYTLILFDLRNRGASETVTDPTKLKGGVHHDVEDIEAVRRHFGIERANLIAHSYVGLTAILYALKYPQNVGRIVQIGPSQPNAATQYPAELSNLDATFAAFTETMGELFRASPPLAPQDACRRFWSAIQVLMVADPADAAKVDWCPCDAHNEVFFLHHWLGNLMPSIHALQLTPEQLRSVVTPVLTIHGRLDRQSPYGAGREWVEKLGNARLLTIPNAAHVPWIEAQAIVFGAIGTFLDGAWPAV